MCMSPIRFSPSHVSTRSHEVVAIHVAVHAIARAGRRFDRRAPAHHRVAFAFDATARSRRVVRGRAFQETPRRDVELERLAPRLRDIGLLRGDLLEERSRRDRRRAAGAEVHRRARVARRRRVEIDDPHVVRDRPHRIVRAVADQRGRIGAALLERHVSGGARVSNGGRIAERALRVGDDGSRILRQRVPRKERDADGGQRQFLHHSDLPLFFEASNALAMRGFYWRRNPTAPQRAGLRRLKISRA